MAIRLQKSGELMMIYGTEDEPEPEKIWSTRRRKLGVLVTAIAAVVAASYFGPHVPGHEIVTHAFKAVVSAIW